MHARALARIVLGLRAVYTSGVPEPPATPATDADGPDVLPVERSTPAPYTVPTLFGFGALGPEGESDAVPGPAGEIQGWGDDGCVGKGR